MTDSNANTSGLSEAWSRLSKTFSDRFYEGYEPEIEAMSAAVVTAASAQARIDAAEARADRLAKVISKACDLLAERTHGNSARSPAHNARLQLEEALQQETQP